MNSNGVLSLGSTGFTQYRPRDFPFDSPPLIAVFWDDFNPRDGGRISYRQTNDSSIIESFHSLLLDLKVGDLAIFFPTLVFITTWYQVPRFADRTVCEKPACCFKYLILIATIDTPQGLIIITIADTVQVKNTLQVLIAADANTTVAVFIYHDIQWGYGVARVGFNAGDGYAHFMLPAEILSNQTINIAEETNSGEAGVFIFRLDSMFYNKAC